jgi:uncharacterized damage-inducible protein DinB
MGVDRIQQKTETASRDIIESIRLAFDRHRALAERAADQLADDELIAAGQGGASSTATIMWHMGANLESRFTDFLTADGEKPWREREDEFAPRQVSRAELMRRWESGWSCLATALDGLDDDDLDRTVHIRHEPMSVAVALHRALAHACYHVGQIVYIARSTRGDDWQWLSIPPGGTAAHNRTMAERWTSGSGG